MKQNLLFNQASALGKRLAMVLTMLLIVGIGQAWGATFNVVYDYSTKGDTWTLTDCEDKSSYWLCPASGTSSVATIPDIFTGKTITSDVVITINNATFGSGNGASATTFKIYNSTACTTQVTASQSGTLASSSTYVNTIYTVTKANVTNFSKDLVLLITKPGRQIRLKSISVKFSYENAAPAVMHKAYFYNGTTLLNTGGTEFAEGAAVSYSGSTPTSCDGESVTFVGWATSTWEGKVTKGDITPDFYDITDGDDLPTMGTADVNYYAVFARETSTTTNKTLTLNSTNLSSAMGGSYSSTDFSYSGISFGRSNAAIMSNTIQIKGGTSNAVWNKTELPGAITSITVTKKTNNSVLTVGTSAQPTTYSKTVSSTTTYTFTESNNYRYFKIAATSSYTQVTSVVIKYSATSYSYSDYITSCITETVVTLDPNGGAIDDDSNTQEIQTENGTLFLPTPTRVGYTFTGWNREENGSGDTFDAGENTNWDESITTLYAQWECDIPEFTLTSTTFARTEGQEIRIASNATNVPANAKFTWYLNGAEVANQSSSELYIASCTIADAGSYTCTISYDDCSFDSENNYSVKVYSVRGLKGEWDTFHPFVSTSDTEGEFTIYLDANTSFKVWDGEYYYGNPESGTMSGTSENWTMQQNFGGDVTLTNIIAGTYTFKLDYSDASNTKISVYYPSKITVYLNPVSGDAGPYYAIHTWDGSNTENLFMEKVDDCDPYRNIYKAEINASHKNLIFVSTKASTVADMWNQKNYQTIDLTYPTDNDKMLFDMSKLYLTPNSNWKQADARFAAYFFGNGDTWVSMTKVTDNLYEVAIPTNKDYPNVIFCRMNPSSAANNWDNKWNQSPDLTITKDKNHYTITEGQDNWSNGTWSTDGYWTTYIPNHTVTFDANGHGTAPEGQCITDGGTATNPGNLSTTGYTFGGWYTDQACNNAWDFENDVVTENITLYAKWTANIHTLTWDVNGGNDLTGTYTSGSVAYGTVIVPPATPTRTGHTFLGWKETDGSTTIAETMPDKDLTYTAQWEEIPSYIVTFSVGNGDTAPESAVVEPIPGSSTELPSLETVLTCVKFVGWTDATNDAAITSSNLYKAGDSYEVTQDITLKAVYAAVGGFVLVTDASELAIGDHIVIAAAGYDVAMGADKGNNRAEVDVEKDDTDNTITTPDGIQFLTLEEGTITGTYAFYTGSGYLYAASSGSNYLKTQETKDDNGSWTISINSEGIATIKAQGSNTRNWLRYNNSGSNIFSCYASGQADVSIYKESITGYTTDPECVMYNVTLCTPTNGTISVDKTIVDPYGSTILTFAPAAGYRLAAVTITSGTAEVGTVSYTSNQTSGGTVKISNIQSDIEVCATFKEIPYYKVTFVDMNADPQTSTEVFQSEFGGDITAPATASAGCDITWKFIGWAPSNSLNGTTEVPANLVEAGGTISGANITSNLVYYSVYSNSSDGTPPFSIGKSGTYYFKAITEDDEEYYATGELNSSDKYPTNSTPYIPFLLTYNSTSKQYTIKNTLNNKYLAPDSYDENALTEQDASYSWDVIQPTLYANEGYNAQAKTGEYLFCYTKSDGTSIRYLYCNGSYFGSWSRDNSKYALYLEPASEMHYYNVSDCTDDYVTMSFHNPFGSSKAQLQYEVGYEEDYYTNTSKKYVNVFPTLEYAGWTFIGWTAGTPYNDIIGEDNLNDENSSADAPTQDIYKTGGGLSYYLGGDVTMYPVFTKFEDNEPFDMVNGGDYYIYYIADGDIVTSVDEYGAAQRIYATGWTGEGSASYSSTQKCDNATLFTFTKLDNGKWTIYDNTFGDFLYARSNDISHREEEDDGTKNIKEWAITIFDGNQFEAIAVEGNALSANSTNAISGTFKNYATSNFNNNSKYYHRVYLGTCTERVYSSNPTNKPAITLSGEPIVTSTQDQSIRAQGELSISATKLAANGTITLTSDNADVYFSTVKDANFTQATKPVTPLTLEADEKGKLAMTTVYVHYKPTSTSSLGVQTANITATTGTEGEEDYATAETTAHVRNLSAKFVIATKVGATWYALPADMTTASNPLGVVIEVDETNMTATAPNSCTYTLFPVKTTNTEYDRYEEYGDRLRFSAVNNSYKGLWANNSKTDLTINNDMVIDQASDGQTGSDLANNSYYEWKVTTTVVDGHWQYTLQTDQTQNQNYLRYWTSAEGTPVGPKWGTYNAGENKLYFLPVTETQPFEYAVVEWYPTKMLIQTDAAIASPTVKVGGEKVASPVLTSKGGKLYEISNLPLETKPNKLLQVSFTADAVNYVNAKVVPIILSRGAKSITGEPFATLTQKVYQYADVVVRDGATLTIDGGTDVANTLLGVTIYPTAKVSVAEGKKLSVHNLTFFGGIDEIYDGSAYTINKYGVPQLSLKGILNKTVTNMDYIMRVNLDQMYQVGVPYDVNLSDITYWDGTTMTLGDNLYVSAYDGQKRANREEKSWVWEVNFTEPILKAGIGYTISADMQTGVGNEYSIIRMPMKNNITSGNTETAKTVQVYAYDNTKGVEITDNHKGWNYLSNPYMVAISGAEADSKLVVGYLRETGTGPWEWVDDTYRYVTIPSDDGKWYDQQKFKEATLLPFKSFFLQIATDGELSFALASRQSAPARYLQSSNEQREVEFEVLLANDTRSDNLGFLIGEDYTPAYEINADLEKMIGSMSVYTIYNGYNLAYNALSPANAKEQIPIGYVVPTVGEYTFALDESSNIEDVEHIYLIDYETSAITDLVTDVYTFTALEQKSDTRFAINVALKSKDNAATGLDNMNTNGELSTKFIYQDKIFILHHGVIYDATGKRVITINK